MRRGGSAILPRGLALAAAMALATPARASAPDRFGYGARAGAMAGTGVASAEGYDAVWANPAGLVGPTRRRLTVGYTGARQRLRLDGRLDPVGDTDAVVIGADLPLPLGGVLRERLALGLGFYFPAGLINRARAPYPEVPRLALIETRTQVVSVMVAAGARVHRRVRVGVGVLALAALVGEISITPDAAGRITTVAEEQLVTDFAPLVGVRVEATRWLALGLSYRGESKSFYDIRITNSLGNRLPITLPTLRIAGVAQFDPHQLALEGAARIRPWLELDLGLTWKHWSAFPLPTENATVGAPPQPASGFHDTVVPRIAAEASWSRGRLRLCGRAGYFFEWSPAPVGPEVTLLDADRHVLTGGLGLEIQAGPTALQLEAFGQWHHLAGNPRARGDQAAFGATLGVDL